MLVGADKVMYMDERADNRIVCILSAPIYTRLIYLDIYIYGVKIQSRFSMLVWLYAWWSDGVFN